MYSAAIPRDNVELAAAESYGIPTVERRVLLGYVSRLYKSSICVAGTHGKTTTTAMSTTSLVLAGRDPSAVIGGKLPLINGYGKAGMGDDIVVEACEYAETFLKLTPYLSVVLNIDSAPPLAARFVTIERLAWKYWSANVAYRSVRWSDSPNSLTSFAVRSLVAT